MLKRFCCFVLALCLCLSIGATALAEPENSGIAPAPAEEGPADEQPADEAQPTESPEAVSEFEDLSTSAIIAKCAILIDANTGKMLFGKNSTETCYPASITKAITCILALKNGNLEDEITVTDVAYKIDEGSSHIGLQVGEVFTLEQLLYGLMLNSGNDAANVIANHIGGSLDGFVEMMNSFAKEIGMENSHFMNPSGLPNEDHYVTAADMSRVLMEGLKIDKFRQIISTKKYDIPKSDKVFEERHFENSNKLIQDWSDYYYADAIGGKTGYTNAAQHTLVSAAERDGMTLAAVVLKDEKEGKWVDMKTLFNFGFDQFAALPLEDYFASHPINATVSNAMPASKKLTLTAQPDEGAATVYTDTKQNIAALRDGTDASTLRMETDKDLTALTAPIAAGEAVATYSIYNEDTLISTGKLVAPNDVAAAESIVPDTNADEEETEPSSSRGGKWFSVLLLVLAILLVLIIVLRIIINCAYNRKHHRRVVYRRKKKARR